MIVQSGASVLALLYGFVGNAARFAVEHIDTLKQAEGELPRRGGEILEQVNACFGIGAETTLVLIGVGQNPSGHPLAMAVAVPATSNPVVMTCAALGALHYGWKAMSDEERERVLSTVARACAIGSGLVRSIAAFAFDLLGKRLIGVMSELRQDIAEVAAVFGRRLGDVTRLLSDRLADGAHFAMAGASRVALSAGRYIPDVGGALSRKRADDPPGD